MRLAKDRPYVSFHTHCNTGARLIFEVVIIGREEGRNACIHSAHELVEISIIEICVEDDELLKLCRNI